MSIIGYNMHRYKEAATPDLERDGVAAGKPVNRCQQRLLGKFVGIDLDPCISVGGNDGGV